MRKDKKKLQAKGLQGVHQTMDKIIEKVNIYFYKACYIDGKWGTIVEVEGIGSINKSIIMKVSVPNFVQLECKRFNNKEQVEILTYLARNQDEILRVSRGGAGKFRQAS